MVMMRQELSSRVLQFKTWMVRADWWRALLLWALLEAFRLVVAAI
jgi:hypothetical protein